jgi:WD40 repeat protein
MLWDAERAQELIELAPSPRSPPTFGLGFSPDGRLLFAAQGAGDLRAWDLGRGTPLFQIDAESYNGRGWVAISPGSDVLATLDGKRAVVLRNATTGAEVRTLESTAGERAGVFSPDGRFAVGVTTGAGTIRVWEVATGRLVAVLDGHTQPVECLAFSPDGRRLASGSFDNTVRIWDFPARKEVMVYRGHSSPIASVAFHPDGRHVVSSGLDASRLGEIRLWDLETARDSQILRGHTGFVRRLAFLPDGQRLVSLGDDGVLKLWDAVSGQETLSIPAHSRNGVSLAVSPDGRRLATSGAEGVIRIWDSGARPAGSTVGH